MGVPAFLLRKLYQRGSLRETADGCFAFALQNPLGNATIIGPPTFVINGIHYEAHQVKAAATDLALISPENPFNFAKGTSLELTFPGRLLRGGNRIHVSVLTTEFDEIDFLVEDKEAVYCDVPQNGQEEE